MAVRKSGYEKGFQMRLVVCVKQVPDTAHLKFSGDGQLLSESFEWVMNPFCEYALETAIRLKESIEGATLVAMSVGAPQAKDVLKRALAMGADEAYLISDHCFTGSDAMTTAHILATAVQKHVPDADLILTGQFSTDGMNGITGPALAASLDMPSITFSKKLEPLSAGKLSVYRETEKGVEVLELTLPGLVAVMKCDYEPRIPSIKGVMKANRMDIPTLTAADLGLAPESVGPAASPTHVLKTWRKPRKEGGTRIDGSDPAVAVKELVGFLQAQKVL